MKRPRTLRWVLLLLMTVISLASGVAVAQSAKPTTLAGEEPEAALALNSAFTYQGQLTDSDIPASGPYDFQFLLYDAASGGNQIGSTATMDDLAINDGVFTVQLDFGANVFQGEARWLEIRVRPGGSGGAYTSLSPRQALTAAPYALHSLSTADHDHYGETWTGAGPGDGLRVENAAASSYAYGVTGVSASTNGRGVYGYASAASGGTFGVQGQSASTSGHGVYGVATAVSGNTDGVFGEAASTSGRGVRGTATAASGSTVGVLGLTASSQGFGVFGEAIADSGTTFGVYGQAISPNGYGVYGRNSNVGGQTYGVYGEAWSTSGRGVYGIASATSGSAFGVEGKTTSTDGRGVYGWADTDTGANIGVYGRSDSVNGYGLYGIATAGGASQSYGVYGISYTDSGYGGRFDGYGADAVYVENLGSGRGLQVRASSDTAIWAVTDAGIAGVDGRASGSTGRGVYGYATASSGINAGVYGRTASAAGYAGYFQGNLHTTGTLTKASGSFKIDHPLDPSNQYLYHSFVESPDMMNIYNGNVLLDSQGTAWVELPEWFEALNQDFRYQLTPIGAAMPDLHIATEIEGNTFQIAGGEPGFEVSWLVTGIRHDPYAEQNRIPVEENKPAGEQGTYLYPQGYSQPESLSLDHQRNVQHQ